VTDDDPLAGVTLEQAADLLYAAAELLTTAPPPIDQLDVDEATRLLSRIRDAVDVVRKVDSLLCARLIRDRWGAHEVEGIGVVRYRRTSVKDRWDERGAAFAVLEARMRERGGELPDPAEVVEWLLEAASIGYYRKTALRAMQIDPGDYFHSEPGNPAVDLPKRDL
jgi:hypothetical protein